ncbi:MAG: hypothetical protein NVSMB14_07160 [Isosphaeraceae bacterium]
MSTREILIPTDAALAVLAGGGLDSAILLGEAARDVAAPVQPLYVRQGFAWEEAENASLIRFLDAIASPNLRAMIVLDLPATDLFATHWSVTGQNVPGAKTADDAVELPGRNVFLLAKSMLWCRLNDFPSVALATLGSNPFADASEHFFSEFESVVNEAIGGTVRVLRPYAKLHKRNVMRRGDAFPLEWTFSCIHPIGGIHCGVCNKCAERRQAFLDVERVDRTLYSSQLD